jgi:uncharacterized protein YehS (DUF1456 family)
MSRNNDVLRSLRYTLDANEAGMAAIFGLGGADVDRAQILAFLERDGEPSAVECSDALTAAFLDGLIVKKRGPSDKKPAPGRLSNNVVLKKLRVAFELRDEDLHAILKLAEFPLSKSEVSALFRQEGHSNYRECGDQALRHFLRGLALRVRGA